MNRALLVGINRYPGCPLQGCVNDVQNMADFLVNHREFGVDDIRLLVDGRATTKAILDRLDWFVEGVKPGDRLMFHYSGHGATTVDRSDDGHVDGVDDVICPVDFDWSEERMIRDDQFVQVFRRLPSGVRFNWVSDSCHSGHLDRDMVAGIITARAFPVPADIAWRQRTARAAGLKRRGIVDGTLEVGFVSGCRSDQTSPDTVIDGTPQGALTGYLLRQLHELPEDTPLATVAIETASALADDGYDQVPQCDGTRANVAFLA